MKKYLSALLVAAVAVFGAVSQAAAYFEQGNLIRVVYSNDGTTEVATDLGTYNATTLAAATNVSAGEVSSLLSNFASGTTLSDLYVAYYINDIYSAGTNPDGTGVYTSGVNDTQSNTKSQYQQFNSAAKSNTVYYQSLLGTTSDLGSGTVVGNSANLNSYYTAMIAAGTKAGMFTGFITTQSGEANLGGGSVDYVDMYLFYYSKPTSSGSGSIVATVRTYITSDGAMYTVINPQAVPIPGALWLLGSGLLSLLGVRRKVS
ncbi:MAG: hypothetical protein AB7W37_09365 [Syntrophobacteraceae bacterium]